MSNIGTYPLQAIIDLTKSEQERKIIHEGLKDHIYNLSQVNILLNSASARYSRS